MEAERRRIMSWIIILDGKEAWKRRSGPIKAVAKFQDGSVPQSIIST